MDNLEALKNKFIEMLPSNVEPTTDKVINSFVGHEEEYKQLIAGAENLTASVYKDDDVVVITPEKDIAELTTQSVKVSDMMKKFKKELDKMSEDLKAYGSSKLRDWNKENNDTAASVRIQSLDGNRTVMVTVKNAYSIDAEKLQSIKKELGSRFDKVFTTETTWSVKNDKVKTVVTIVKNALGKAGTAFIKEAFKEEISYKVKARKDYEDLLVSDITNETRKILIDAVKPQAPAITYPK